MIDERWENTNVFHGCLHALPSSRLVGAVTRLLGTQKICSWFWNRQETLLGADVLEFRADLLASTDPANVAQQFAALRPSCSERDGGGTKEVCDC